MKGGNEIGQITKNFQCIKTFMKRIAKRVSFAQGAPGLDENL